MRSSPRHFHSATSPAASATSTSRRSTSSPWAAPISDSLIYGNSAPEAGGIGFWFFSITTITNCTIVNNTATVGGGAFHLENAADATIENSIVWGNTGQPDFASMSGVTTLTMTRCDVQGGYPGLGNIAMDPRFVDAAAGDYRLRGDSPCFNRGDSSLPGLGTADFEGDPRVLYGRVDMGADEMGDASRDPAAAGNVGVAPSGVPESVLLVHGSAGGRARRVTVGVGRNFTVRVRRPRASPGPAGFAIYGLLRAPLVGDVVTLPGIGPMTFVPCPLLPAQQPTLFTLTDNLSVGPCAQLLASTPAPWQSPKLTIPVPLTFALQGLIEETPGVVKVTNAVIVEVR